MYVPNNQSARRTKLVRAFQALLANPDPFTPPEYQLVDKLFEVEPGLETDSTILAQARGNYERQREKLISRPAWEDLRANDPFHMGLRHAAIEQAQDQHRQWMAAQKAEAIREAETETGTCPICGPNCTLNEDTAT